MGFSVVAGVVAISPASAVPAPDPGTYVALTPMRLLDTRNETNGGIAPSGTRSLVVTGTGAVPDAADASAVVLNVTVTNPTAPGYISAYADQTAQPTASNVNFNGRDTVPNLVVVPIGSNGVVDFFNGSPGTTQLLVDIDGYYEAGTPTDPGAFVSLTPSRLLDTRNGTGGSAPGSLGTTTFAVAGQGGVPVGATEALLNITAVTPGASGYITAFADGATQPDSSNLNFTAGVNRPNLVAAPIGTDGKVALFNGSAATTQLLADVFGYFVPGGTPAAVGSTQPLTPARMLDTRDGSGTADFIDDSPPPLAGFATEALQVEGRSGVPASGVAAVILNVTVTNPQNNGYITAYAHGGTQPVVSNLNFVPSQTVANLVIAPVGADGQVSLFNGSPNPTDLIADVAGYVLATASTPPVANVSILNCDNPPAQFGPEAIQVLLDCDNFNFLYNMTWSSWQATTASGSGLIAFFDGDEYEVASVNVQLSSPTLGTCGENFALATLSYPDGQPDSAPSQASLPTVCPS